MTNLYQTLRRNAKGRSAAADECQDARLRRLMTFTSKAIAVSAFTMLLCIGILSYRSTVRDEEDRGWVTHTHLVTEKLQAILMDVTQAETGQRGYILTGQEKDLVPYRAGLAQVARDMSDFRNLTSDNPKQQEAIRLLDPLVTARLAGLEGRLYLGRSGGLAGGAEAAAKLNSGEGLMDEVRARISEMRQTEDQLLVSRLNAAAAGGRKMKAVIAIGNVLAFLILLAAGFLVHREALRRNLAERQLKQAYGHLEQRTSELSYAIGELETFSYSVAHDLRAPLRHIAGYSNVLREDYAPLLDTEGRRCLERIVGGAQQMGQLVDDLLSLSKIGLQEPSLETTSLDVIVRLAMEEIGPQHRGREIEWQIGKLFDVNCDPALIKQVFVNLLSNAVKYTGKRDHAVIQVGRMEHESQPVIFIRDNGAGFEMKYVSKLFGIFQRLHKAADFEGTGVGLAIVQRIIRKHGGRIWAEAEPDRGATFFFSLDRPEVNPATQRQSAVKKEVALV